MPSLAELVQSLGLTSSEARLYVAGLGHPGVGVHELSRLTNMKRPTIYHSLHVLEQKGLVAKKGTGRRLVFVMQSPERLRDTLDEEERVIDAKRNVLESLLPLLTRSLGTASPVTQVQHLEGIEGMKTLVDEAMYCKSRTWNILAPKRNFFSDMDPEYGKKFLATRKGRGIVARTLWERPDMAHMPKRHLTAEELQDRHPRYLPEAFRGRFSSTMILFDDKVAFLSSFRAQQGILLQSQEVADLLTMMFDGLWLSSVPYEELMKP